jgi:hypothetical protein
VLELLVDDVLLLSLRLVVEKLTREGLLSLVLNQARRFYRRNLEIILVRFVHTRQANVWLVRLGLVRQTQSVA